MGVDACCSRGFDGVVDLVTSAPSAASGSSIVQQYPSCDEIAAHLLELSGVAVYCACQFVSSSIAVNTPYRRAPFCPVTFAAPRSSLGWFDSMLLNSTPSRFRALAVLRFYVC